MSEPAFFRGEWIEPGHGGYDDARSVFNQRAVAEPKLIARCGGVADVVAAVKHAREHGFRIHPRCTGYNLGAPTVPQEMVIDLSLMRGIQILPEQRVARVQGGMRGGELQTEAGVHGLGAATGGLSGTGVGLLLGGGIGHLGARAGYATDNVVGFEMVTATGEVISASPDENPDIFWAVRGAPGSFGVVTALEIRLHDVPPVVHLAEMTWALDNLDGVFEALRTSWDWASDDCNVISQLNVTALEGRGGLEMLVTHVGPEGEALAEIERLRSFGAPDVAVVTPMPFRDCHYYWDEYYQPCRTLCVEQPVTEFSEELLEACVARIREPAGTGARTIETIPRLGALQRAPEFPSAVRETGEEPTWSVVAATWWEDAAEDESHEQWTKEVIADIRRIAPVANRAVPNTVSLALDLDGLEWLYGDRLGRLRQIKRVWDPDSLFCGKYDIPPAGD